MANKIHIIDKISFSKDIFKINIDGVFYSFELAEVSEKLLSATKKERASYNISPSGYGINWPLVDEDLSVGGLLKLINNKRKVDDKKTAA